MVGVDRPCDLGRQRLAGVLVNDVQQLHGSPVGCGVELEIQRPDVVGPLRTKTDGRHERGADPLPFAFAGRHPQPLLTPQPLDLLAVHQPALVADSRPREPVAPARMLPRELPQPDAQRFVAIVAVALSPLRGAVLTGDPARPPLRQRKPLLQHRHGLASARRAHQFPRAISFNA